MIKYLYEKHLLFPNKIICSRSSNMVKKSKNELMEYSKWELNCYIYRHKLKKDICGMDIFLNSGAGTLFPPNILPKETTNEEVFTKICPFADDVWLNAMRILNNIEVISIKNPQYLIFAEKSPYALYDINGRKGQNDIQLKKVFDKYDLYSQINYLKY